MKRYAVGQLDVSDAPGALASFVKGRRIARGAISFREEGEVSHPEHHTHDNEEIFIALNGSATGIRDCGLRIDRPVRDAAKCRRTQGRRL